MKSISITVLPNKAIILVAAREKSCFKLFACSCSNKYSNVLKQYQNMKMNLQYLFQFHLPVKDGFYRKILNGYYQL